jgi:hypothetical protein
MGGLNFVLITVAFALMYVIRKQLVDTTEQMQREIDGLKGQASGSN